MRNLKGAIDKRIGIDREQLSVQQTALLDAAITHFSKAEERKRSYYKHILRDGPIEDALQDLPQAKRNFTIAATLLKELAGSLPYHSELRLAAYEAANLAEGRAIMSRIRRKLIFGTDMRS